MLLTSQEPHQRWYFRHKIMRLFLLVTFCGLSFAALALPIAIRPSTYPIRVSDVAPQDIVAPYSLSYPSRALTDQAITDAENKVQPVYLAADPVIARRQIEKLRTALNFITNVRLDSYATVEQQTGDLGFITELNIDPQLALRIISLSDSRWQLIESEALNVLEQAMRSTIREDAIIDTRARIPTLISYSFPEDQALIVYDLVAPFVTANSLYSEEKTRQEIEHARNDIKPITRTYVAGEIIVRRGQIITPVQWEALQMYNLVQPTRSYIDLIAAGALVIVAGTFTAMFINKRKISSLHSPRNIMLVGLTFIMFLFAARLLVPNRTVVPYLFPLAAFGLTISTVFSLEAGLVLSLTLSILSTYGLSNQLDLTIFYTLPGLIGMLVLGKGRRVASFFLAGIAIGVAGGAIVAAYRLSDQLTDWIGIATLIISSVLNGLASASLALLLQFLFSQILGVTTALQLLDLLRPDHPLLQYMLINAPGSYQHSLQVSNLAEQAAEALGADAILVRVGAIYHDCGKAANPLFFIENQVSTRINPHDDLDPYTSAATILRHVNDGITLARKYRLPSAVQDFIREHHGTTMARYQYARALEAAGDDPSSVDKEKFRYPGPKPRSKETALLMLADGVEARARAEMPKNEAELRTVIKKVIDYLQKEEQLNDTPLTFRDLSLVSDTFVNTLLNVYHPRIPYPEIKTAHQSGAPTEDTAFAQPASEPSPTLPSVNKPKTP